MSARCGILGQAPMPSFVFVFSTVILKKDSYGDTMQLMSPKQPLYPSKMDKAMAWMQQVRVVNSHERQLANYHSSSKFHTSSDLAFFIGVSLLSS
ncbi:hypothetical protein HOLleu_20134 [Holothuria leucospilota]|uniref:Uncharacterized protein n=1 Tax=Holothuria leucospilota TaxID=206669 RepID=A0A9Q1C0L9_HOLLE|nr:hypothetical protein HOLleu_20134 [Holothuria leucospilota]